MLTLHSGTARGCRDLRDIALKIFGGLPHNMAKAIIANGESSGAPDGGAHSRLTDTDSASRTGVGSNSTFAYIKGNREMFTSFPIRRTAMWAACAFAFSYGVASAADDMVSFATAGYASGLHSMELMHKIDTDGDGTSRKTSGWPFTRNFSMLDKDKSARSMQRNSSARAAARSPALHRWLCQGTEDEGDDAQDRHRWGRHGVA